jgi:hypothetical protein
MVIVTTAPGEGISKLRTVLEPAGLARYPNLRFVRYDILDIARRIQ